MSYHRLLRLECPDCGAGHGRNSKIREKGSKEVESKCPRCGFEGMFKIKRNF